MNAARWERVDELFHRCISKDDTTVDQLLADVKTTDPELAYEVRSMLDNFNKSNDFLETGAHEWANIEAGQTLGPWRIVRELGRGGMSTVYLAERNDGRFIKHVAVKFLHGFIRGDKMHQRLETEQRVLARLNHPNIAQLIDSGITDAGRPYFILEFVDGVSMLKWCNREKLSLDQRLDLFDQVASAVQYAHQHLVVHRDLKPSNILVDLNGNVKLLDFGIAKIMDDEQRIDSPATKTGLYLMTPEYASPEQLRGAAITTSSDVYSLGIVLFELLTGRHPYPSVPGNPLEYTRRRLETNPSKPSTLVFNAVKSEGGGENLLHHEYIQELIKRLRGDLDTIVLTALQSDSSRRYGSIEQLRSDIKNYRQNKPISARPDSTVYRIGKFAKRHRSGVIISSVAVIMLVVATVIAHVQAERARLEKDKAIMVTSFLQDMLQSPNPYNEGREVLMVDVVARAAERMDTSFVNYPDVAVMLGQTIGVTFRELGKYDEALKHLTTSLNMMVTLNGLESGDVTTAMSNLALVHQRLGNYDIADSLFTQAYEIDLELYGRSSDRYAKRLNDMGISKWYLGDYESAEPMIRESVELEKKLKGPDHMDVASGLDNLATLLSDKGAFADALLLYQRELNILRKHHPDDAHPSIPQALSHIGVSFSDVGAYDSSKVYHKKALALYRQIHGEDHADVAYAMNNLAATFNSLGQPDSSIALLNDALEISINVLGPKHPNVGIQLNNIARAKREMGDITGAEHGYREALDIWLASLGEDHPYQAYGYHNLGTTILTQERYRDALPLLEEAYRIRKLILPESNPEFANTMSILGYCLYKLERMDQAEQLLKPAHETLLGSLGADHASTKAAQSRMDEFYSSRRKLPNEE